MRKLLQQFKKIIFFDTETTGLDPEKDQIIELAAALVTENGIELKIDAFCKLPEGEKIPEKIVELTHITDDMLADKGMGQVKRLPEYKLIHNRPHIQRHGGKITPAAMRGTNEAEDGPKPVKIQRGAHNEQIKPGLSDS